MRIDYGSAYYSVERHDTKIEGSDEDVLGA